VRKVYATTGNIETLSGNSSEQFLGDGGPANLASLYGPYSVYFDQTGNLLIADLFHNRIREISGTMITLPEYATIRVGKVSAPQAEGYGKRRQHVTLMSLRQRELCDPEQRRPGCGHHHLQWRGARHWPTDIAMQPGCGVRTDGRRAMPVNGSVTVNSNAADTRRDIINI
jgi:hypothetical protein